MINKLLDQRLLIAKLFAIIDGMKGFNPQETSDTNWLNWMSIPDFSRCEACEKVTG